MAKNNQVCEHHHHSIVPILAILVAISFLLEAQGYLTSDAVRIIWPILLGVGGMVRLVEDRCDCC